MAEIQSNVKAQLDLQFVESNNVVTLPLPGSWRRQYGFGFEAEISRVEGKLHIKVIYHGASPGRVLEFRLNGRQGFGQTVLSDNQAEHCLEGSLKVGPRLLQSLELRVISAPTPPS